MLDAKKALPVLKGEWESCTKCALGEHRIEVGGEFVFGEGAPRSILLVGEGPGRVEEEMGQPFVGPSGAILREALARLNITEFYMTNCVSCRSCSLVTNPDGTPMIRKSRRGEEVMYRDEPPTDKQLEACLPRLHEEIFLVDPVIIVALGAKAASTLAGAKISILAERGKERHISVPGAAQVASLTEKKGVWARRVKGQASFPTEQNELRYLMIPTLHPAYVARNIGDMGPRSAFQLFYSDLRKASRAYERYMHEAYGSELRLSDSPAEAPRVHTDEEEDGDGHE